MSLDPTLSSIVVTEVEDDDKLHIGPDMSVSLTRKFLVRLRETKETIPYDRTKLPYTILTHPDIPDYHAIHTTLFGLWVTDISLSIPNSSEPNVWEVRVLYEMIDVPRRGWADTTKYAEQFGAGSYVGSTPFPEYQMPWRKSPIPVFEDSGSYEEATGHAFGFAGCAKLKVDGTNTKAIYTSAGLPNVSSESPFGDMDIAITQDPDWEPKAATAPIVNSLGDSYTDVPAIVRSLKTYTWQWAVVASETSTERFEDTSFWKNWLEIGDTMNSSAIQITGIYISAFTGRVKSATQELCAFMGFPYYKLRLTVEIKESGWITPILNDGTRFRPSAGAEIVKYNNESGGTPTVKLDPSGVYLDPRSSDISTPYWNVYIMQPWKAWSCLGLPSDTTPFM